MTEKFYTVRQLSQHLGFTRKIIYNWLKSGKIKSIKFGGEKQPRHRIPESELERLKQEMYSND